MKNEIFVAIDSETTDRFRDSACALATWYGWNQEKSFVKSID